MSPLPKLGVAPERAAEEWRKALKPLGCGVDVALARQDLVHWSDGDHR